MLATPLPQVLLVDFNLQHVYLSKWLSSLLMILALGVMLTVMYVDYTNFHPTLNEWSKVDNAAYQSIGRLG